jgi:hypothetical protein
MGAEIGIYILKSVTLNFFVAISYDYETANLIVLITKRFG